MKRQLAAVLYADVAGYSRLTGLDEEETHRKLEVGLNLLTDFIVAHGGRKLHEAKELFRIFVFKSIGYMKPHKIKGR